MDRDKHSATPSFIAGGAIALYSAAKAIGAVVRLVWGIGGLTVSLLRLAYLSIFDRSGK